jgi:ethanolamine ammonia-lyase large subunit
MTNPDELKQLLLLSNPFKEGDLPIGGTRDEKVVREARQKLSTLTIGEINSTRLVDDGVSEALSRTLTRAIERHRAEEISHVPIGRLKAILTNRSALPWMERYRGGLSSEVIAAISKLMTDDELSNVARMLFNALPGNEIAIGSRYHFGSRIQPNSPGDDDEEVLFSVLEGLSYGCGDVILGVNPASDDVETIVRLEDLLRRVVERLQLPTRYSVLSDIVKQTTARERTRVDIGFQSLAGTSKALAGMVGLDADGIAELASGFEGLYFETGQGSEVTNGTAEGIDMVTLESRSYGLARAIRESCSNTDGPTKWMIVNDVAGFIGPELFRTADQLRRACLEDMFMAKLHGITMGLDVCATFHMGIDPIALQNLTAEIVERTAPAYLMAVAGNADPMLGYMTTSFREHPQLRKRFERHIASPMQQRLDSLGLWNVNGKANGRRDTASIYAAYMKAGGDKRTLETLSTEGTRRLSKLQERGFDLGIDDSYARPQTPSDKRMQAIYEHARKSLYASLDERPMKDVLPGHLKVRTRAADREEYLSYPSLGECISDEDTGRIHSLYSARRPQVQVVISDGLNANAINENLREFLPALHHWLTAQSLALGDHSIVVQNGRVRAGYHIGAILDVDAVVHLIGERPGTGLNMLSAYLTFGRDKAGQSRWSIDLDHSCTTAICGINRLAKHPLIAAQEIAKTVRRMFNERRSGVELGTKQVM